MTSYILDNKHRIENNGSSIREKTVHTWRDLKASQKKGKRLLIKYLLTIMMERDKDLELD